MNDPATLPDPIEDTLPDTDLRTELLEAVEWLKRAGIVSGERPAFSRFFDEVVEASTEDEAAR